MKTPQERILLRSAPGLERPPEPVKVALIGAGSRASAIYGPAFASLEGWIEPVAVCDPVEEHAGALGEKLGLPAYGDIRALVRERPMEAALVVTPVPTHHSISVFLSSHGIHNIVETSWASFLEQSREMIDVARANGAVVRVAENFFRYPKERFAQLVRDSGFVGPIRRIVTYDSHTGYHNNSCWIRFAGSHPKWVQAVHHEMETPHFRSLPHRYHVAENHRLNVFAFDTPGGGGLLVVDQAANVKNWLGRYPRDGYTEWQGTRGALVNQANPAPAARRYDGPEPSQRSRERSLFQREHLELRYCADAGHDHETGEPTISAVHDELSPVTHEFTDRHWVRSYAWTRDGLLEHVNPHRPAVTAASRLDYLTPVLGHLREFALNVRGLGETEFDEEDAHASLMMDVLARESALSGRRLDYPLQGDSEVEAEARRKHRQQFGVDPMDVEGMLAVSHPRP